MNRSNVREVHEAQRPPAVSQTDMDEERAAGEGMGTARVESPKQPTPAEKLDGPWLQKVRDGIKQHPYAVTLAAAALVAGVGILIGSRARRNVALRAGILAITEVVREVIGASLSVQP